MNLDLTPHVDREYCCPKCHGDQSPTDVLPVRVVDSGTEPVQCWMCIFCCAITPVIEWEPVVDAHSWGDYT